MKRIDHLESCDCKKSCFLNGSLSKEDGETWTIGCEECKCKSGEITCINKRKFQMLFFVITVSTIYFIFPGCPDLDCKNPVKAEGECCPKCLSKNCHTIVSAFVVN